MPPTHHGEPPRHQGTKVFTKRILGVFSGCLGAFVVATVRADGSKGDGVWLAVDLEVGMPRSRRLLAAPAAATDAALRH